MRIPKYKAYVKEYKEVLDVRWINFDKEIVNVNMGFADKNETVGWDGTFNFDEVELMEYTGVEDYYNGEIIYDEEIEMNGKIYFEEGCYKVDFINGMCWLLRDCQYSKKIGNIYQNKELLEGEN